MTNARLIQAIREATNAEIADLMEWGNQAEGLTLTDIEDRVLEARQRTAQAMMRALLEQRGERRNAEMPVNPETGKRLHPNFRIAVMSGRFEALWKAACPC
ncbi:MAG: hypothetical protein ACK4WM_05145 [Thermoflexales bacterium]